MEGSAADLLVDSLIDHDEKPRELDVLSRGQCDLWDDHQGMSGAEGYLCRHSLQPHRVNVFSTLRGYHFTSRRGDPQLGSRGVRGLTTSFERWKCRASHRGSSAELRVGISPPR